MGADLIGWRDCSLQAALGPEGFLGKLKLRAYASAIESQVPPEQRAEVKVVVMKHGPDGPSEREVRYADMVVESAAFQAGIPDCATCPLAGGEPLGCYRFVPYPVDESFERLVFDFFASEVENKDSTCRKLWEGIVSRVPDSGTGWHERRGPDARTGALAQLPAPLVHRFGGLFRKSRVDSAQILQSLFVTLDDPVLVAVYFLLFTELMLYADRRGISVDDSATLAAVARYADLVAAVAEGAQEGWAVLADA